MNFRIEKSYWQQDIKRKDMAVAVGKSILILVGLAYLFYHSLFGVFLLAPVAYVYFCMERKECEECKCQEFKIQFQEVLQSLTAALNVGYSIENAFREALIEIKKLYGNEAAVVRELLYITRQLEMNVTVEQALGEFADRVGVEEVRTFVTVFGMTKRNGGDAIAVLKNTMEKLCMKMEVKREIRTLVAAKKMEFKVMTVIPAGIIVYMKISFAEFMSVLYGNAGGIVIMSIALGIYLAAYYLGKTMLEIEV